MLKCYTQFSYMLFTLQKLNIEYLPVHQVRCWSKLVGLSKAHKMVNNSGCKRRFIHLNCPTTLHENLCLVLLQRERVELMTFKVIMLNTKMYSNRKTNMLFEMLLTICVQPWVVICTHMMCLDIPKQRPITDVEHLTYTWGTRCRTFNMSWWYLSKLPTHQWSLPARTHDEQLVPSGDIN